MKRSLMVIFVLCLLVFSAAAVFANVTFDPITGTGFVGKGDVQSAFGWNNRELQENAGGLSFQMVVTMTFPTICSWFDENGSEHPFPTSATLTYNVYYGNIRYHARTHGQIDGFILDGFGRWFQGRIPRPPCHTADGHDGVLLNYDQEPIARTDSLVVIYGGTGLPGSGASVPLVTWPVPCPC